MKAIVIIFLTILILSSSMKNTGNTAEENIKCSTVAKPDLQNAKIENDIYVNGKACSSDGMIETCDWEHTIVSDEILRPVPGKEVRFVVINKNHVTGSGAWDTILVFDCFNGNLRKIFENRYLYGVKINKKSDGEITATSGEWQPDDSGCCPSMEKTEIYRWNPSKNTYTLKSTSTISREGK